MLRQGTQAYRNVVAGLLLPVTLVGCFMNDPVEPADASNAPPPTGTNTAPEIWGNAPRVVKVSVPYSLLKLKAELQMRSRSAFSLSKE